MLLRTFPLALVLLAAAAGGCSAVPSAPSAQQRAEAAVATLLAVAASPEAGVAEFAPLMVSQADDPARRWRVAADPSIPEEARGVRGVAEDLRRLLAGVSRDGRFSYTVEAFSREEESEGVWHGLTIRFDDPERTRILVGFLPVDGRLLLGDID